MTRTKLAATYHLPSRVYLREVGPRDGLQNEDHILPTSQKIQLIDALSHTGLHEIEAASFVHPKFVPQMADAADVFTGIQRLPGIIYSAIAPNRMGARRALDAGVDAVQVFLSASEAHNRSNVHMSIAESLNQAAEIAHEVQAAGRTFDAVLSVVFGCPFEGDVPFERVLALSERLLTMGAAQITLGDTTGMAHPLQVREVFVHFQRRFPGVSVRFHPHSARGAGLANVLAALEVGIDRFDASIGGIGGCPFAPGAPGNVCSEDLVHMLHEMGIATGINLPRLIEVAQLAQSFLGHELPSQTMKSGICGHIPDGEPHLMSVEVSL
ncbi:MAG: hydroxymethylglutaryl-CoA lyase [Herpetosiphonaceae bacterium]|nr:hydroxymethylglutaryl-CoA lyase [Herpetosiphonaceae bacterium]